MAIQAQHVSSGGARVYMGTIMHEELHPAFTRLMTELDIRAGTFQLIGGLTDIEFRVYDFINKTRRPPVIFSGALEVVACYGHLSYSGGMPHVHVHASVTVPHSGIWMAGGHVQRAAAYAVEYTLRAYDGGELVRRYNEETGLYLWDVPEI